MTVGNLASESITSSYTFYGTSLEAEAIQQDIPWQRWQIEDLSTGIAAYWDGHRRALSELADVYEEASEGNWDGYDAAAIDPMSYFWARRFLMLMPVIGCDVEIACDPDGEVSVEWYHAPDRVFSVSIGRDGRLSYAGRFGRSTVSGTDFLEDDVPSGIHSCIARLQTT